MFQEVLIDEMVGGNQMDTAFSNQLYEFNTLWLPPNKQMTLRKGFIGLLLAKVSGHFECAQVEFDIDRSGLINYLRVSNVFHGMFQMFFL